MFPHSALSTSFASEKLVSAFFLSSKDPLNVFLSFECSSEDTWKNNKASSLIVVSDTSPHLSVFCSNQLQFYLFGLCVRPSRGQGSTVDCRNTPIETFHKIIGGFKNFNNTAILTRQTSHFLNASGGIFHPLQISEVAGFLTVGTTFSHLVRFFTI